MIRIQNVRVVLAIACLAWIVGCTTTQVSNPEVEFGNSVVIGRGQCVYKERIYVCFVIQKENKLHMVAVDATGIVAVYKIKEFKRDYIKDDLEVVWERPQEAKKPSVQRRFTDKEV